MSITTLSPTSYCSCEKRNSSSYRQGVIVQRDSNLSEDKRTLIRAIIAKRKEALDALAKY